MNHLVESLERAATLGGGVTFLSGDGGDRVGWRELHADALRMAAGLRARGAGPDRPVAVLASTSRPAVTAAFAAWLAGSSLTMLPTPARTMDLTSYLDHTRTRLAALGDPLLLVGPPWEDAIPALAGAAASVGPLAGAADGPGTTRWRRPPLAEHDPAVLQLTSGTTDAAKTVRITHANVAANTSAIRDATGHADIHGRMLSWLPLSHDMGLIGALILPLTCGECDLLLAPPSDFLARPASWLRLAAHHRAHTIVAPNAAYALAGKLLREAPPLDLSALRVALSGAEPIDPATVEEFLDAARPHRFPPGAFVAAYGMAEATVAVTLSPPGRGLRVDRVDPDQLERHGRAVPTDGARARPLPLLGPPLRGLELRITDPATGRALDDREVGEIHIRGTSVTTGYHNDPAATHRALVDGWLRSGDLGYLAGGELVVCGRIKDTIILSGRNIYPADVERAVEGVVGVRAGNVVAFGHADSTALGGERLVIAVESRAGDPAEIRRAIRDRVRAALDVSPHRVLVLPPGSIPKTPSGKLQRTEARRMFAS